MKKLLLASVAALALAGPAAAVSGCYDRETRLVILERILYSDYTGGGGMLSNAYRMELADTDSAVHKATPSMRAYLATAYGAAAEFGKARDVSKTRGPNVKAQDKEEAYANFARVYERHKAYSDYEQSIDAELILRVLRAHDGDPGFLGVVLPFAHDRHVEALFDALSPEEKAQAMKIADSIERTACQGLP